MSTDQLSRQPYGEPHCVVETRKTLTADEYLEEVFLHQKDFPVVSTVNFDNRLDEMNAGCSEPTRRQAPLKND